MIKGKDIQVMVCMYDKEWYVCLGDSRSGDSIFFYKWGESGEKCSWGDRLELGI